MKDYGKELILDLHGCDSSTFTRKSIRKFFKELCELIDMKREDLHFWDELYTPKKDRFTEEHLIGTSAVQFITTSNITIHTLDILENVYINVFSCKEFDTELALKFSEEWFRGKIVNSQIIERI